MASEPGEREAGAKGLERLLFFSDAVVAIAITLVALPLVDLARDVHTDAAGHFFTDNRFALLGAGISFVVLFALWRGHHQLFTRATGYRDSVMWVNALWLACITGLPIVTVVVIQAGGQDRVASGVYVAVITLAIVCVEAMWALLTRRGLLVPGGDAARSTPAAHTVLPGLSLVALLIVLVAPQVYLWPMALLALERPVVRLLPRRSAPRVER